MFKKWLTFGLSSEQEDRYRNARWATDLGQARIIILLILLFTIGFAINDYIFLGLSWRFYAIVVLRLVVLVGGLILLRWTSNTTDYRSFDKAEFAWETLMVVLLVVVSTTRPQAFVAHFIVAVVTVFAVLLALPNRFGRQVTVSLGILVGETLVVAPAVRAQPQATVSIILSMFSGCGLAILNAHHLHAHRRGEFLAWESEQQSRAAAERELVERKRAEEALGRAKDEPEQRVAERTTELAQLAAQLRALAGELTLAEQRERTRLAKILHDHLQQLLVAAKSRTAVLVRGADGMVTRAANEIEALLDESIAASRSLSAELSPPILHEAGLSAGVQWLARRMAEKQGLSVDLKIEDIGPLPEDIQILLYESIRELLLNIVKHARTRSAFLNLRRIDGALQVTVSDEGVGFDPNSKGDEPGRGFGLFSIRERLHLVGGSLQIESVPGQGSRFVISVPIIQDATVTPRVPQLPVHQEELYSLPMTPVSGGKIRVLIADDHAMVRQGIAYLLGNESNIEIIGEAADGQEAVELAAKLLPDIIVMDISMPKLNGIEATRVIHNDFPDIRIIGLSMFEEADTAQAMREAGVVHYVTKSCMGKTLIAAIRKYGVFDKNNTLTDAAG